VETPTPGNYGATGRHDVHVSEEAVKEYNQQNPETRCAPTESKTPERGKGVGTVFSGDSGVGRCPALRGCIKFDGGKVENGLGRGGGVGESTTYEEFRSGITCFTKKGRSKDGDRENCISTPSEEREKLQKASAGGAISIKRRKGEG